ncbi:hypothetical protein EMIHUDRAFT_238379 [Emiliania huxleyi CCMP1516]|uniref:Uncharacterized protein n=2 Tax=Emiliania huxleyi TaxID=2903 RepID=A0A0D3JMN5_EMIH1|nr:hypothetical protein EMIHUDRAFT_238379 [Emiliania huxleyi CCMP1516]EOD24770.1 hypothetical protein EMIHUDRAFT_238379 [Emiliania huxleyi CCMP1516]|eukprot:XP_005777199.1 hypothetical protein EMIHUDRAFT_238379 [Emiliania huxleyi CCMP1516]
MPLPTLALRHMQVTPNYMKSLVTAHDSAQTAFKDKAANAKDAGATEFKVEVRTIYGKTALLTYDNGPGPVDAVQGSPTCGTVTLDSFMGPLFNLGGTTALGDARKIGQYGVGAITGPLRIGKDVLVATRSADYLYCALLSSSLIAEEQTDGILLPYLVYSFAEGVWYENVPGSSFGFFDRFTAFGTDLGRPDLDKLLEVCMELLPAVGGLLHVISNLADEIDVGKERGDIMMPKLAHEFDTSLSRYLSYAFYKSGAGDDSDFKITIKGRAASHRSEAGKGPFRETMLKCKRTLPPYKAHGTCPNTLPIEADVVVGFTTKENVGTSSNVDELPMGLCISINGVMVTMFELLPKQANGFRSHASVADKVRTYWHGLVVLVKLKLADDNKLEDYGLLINQRKDGFQENKAFTKLKAAILSKVLQQYIPNVDFERLVPTPLLLAGPRFGSSEEAVRHVSCARWPSNRPPAPGQSSAPYKKAALAILGLGESWTEQDAKKAFLLCDRAL